MIRFNRIAILTLATAFAVSAPAAANAKGTAHDAATDRVTQVDGAICARAPGNDRCANYQSRLLLAVSEEKMGRNARASMEEVGRRQLNALIDSIG